MSELKITYKQNEPMFSLTPSDMDLVECARRAADKAYAPYSGFAVGAAALTDGGEIISASNQENISYPEGVCAERVLINYIKATSPESRIVAIAIAAKRSGVLSSREIYPCGGCRQVLWQAERRQGSPIRIIASSAMTYSEVNSAADLLPLAFE